MDSALIGDMDSGRQLMLTNYDLADISPHALIAIENLFLSTTNYECSEPSSKKKTWRMSGPTRSYGPTRDSIDITSPPCPTRHPGTTSLSRTRWLVMDEPDQMMRCLHNNNDPEDKTLDALYNTLFMKGHARQEERIQ